MLFIDHRYFLIVDDLEAPVQTTWELHLHSLEPMRLDEAERHAVISRGDARLDAYFLERRDVRFLLTDQFDPPNDDPGYPDLPAQHHLRMTTVDVVKQDRLAMLLISGRQSDEPAYRLTRLDQPNQIAVQVEFDGHIDTLLVGRTPGPITHDGVQHDALAVWLCDGNVMATIQPPSPGKSRPRPFSK